MAKLDTAKELECFACAVADALDEYFGIKRKADATKPAVAAASVPTKPVAAATAKPAAAATSKPAAKKTIETIAREVIRGDWGNGEARNKKLTAVGYDYAAVQKKVNELLK